MKRKLVFAALALAAWQLLAAEAAACSCAESLAPPCAAYWRADAVFAGIVTDIKKLPPPSAQSPPKALLRFFVEDAFRGIAAREVDVATLSGTSCDTSFKKGERWLVYAYRDGETGRLEILPCTRTGLLDRTGEDLDYIRGLQRGAPGQSALGRFVYMRSKPLPGMKVSVRGAGQTFETETDADGSFAVRLPRAGPYTVRAVVPYSASAMSQSTPVRVDAKDDRSVIEYEAEVVAGRCDYAEIDVYEIDLHATAEVSGKVLDESDRPVTRGYVYLHAADPKEGSDPGGEGARLDADGGFKFERVAVGNYYLVINPRDEAPGESDAPHPKTFYPGAAERSKATPVVVTEGLKLEGLIIRARPALRERVLTGAVVWPDGKPAAGASVSLYDMAQDRYIRMVTADAEGRFRVSLYGDFKYGVSASVYGDKVGESEKVKVPESEDGPKLKLIVKPK